MQGGHRGYLLERLWQYYFTNMTRTDHPVSRLAVPMPQAMMPVMLAETSPQNMNTITPQPPTTTAYYPPLSTELKTNTMPGAKKTCPRKRRRAAAKRAQTVSHTALLAPAPSGLATGPDGAGEADCTCCQQTNAVLERYCHEQQPMGDLDLEKFECAVEMGTEVSYVSEGETKRFTEVKSCKCDCETRLEALRSGCNLACTELPLTCPACSAPPPPSPPPPPPPAPPPFSETCHPVPESCCESMLVNLQKFCFSFKPDGVAVKVPDASHWDGGDWRAPASFDSLCEEYRPSECQAPMSHRFLSFVARQYDPDICKAALSGQCDDVCDHQCPSPPPPLFDSARFMGSGQQQKLGAALVCANGVCDDQARAKDAPEVPVGQREARKVEHADSLQKLSQKVLGGVTDKVQTLIGSAAANSTVEVHSDVPQNATFRTGAALVAARAPGWALDDRRVRTAVCPAGQRNAAQEECLAAMREAAEPQGLEVRGLKKVNNGASSDVPAGCTYSHFSRNALFNSNSAGGSGPGQGNKRYQLVCIGDSPSEASAAKSTPPVDAAPTTNSWKQSYLNRIASADNSSAAANAKAANATAAANLATAANVATAANATAAAVTFPASTVPAGAASGAASKPPSRCLAVSDSTTDDWCQNACGFSATSVSCPTTLCKCEPSETTSDRYVAAYAARAAVAEAADAAEPAESAADAEASGALARDLSKNVDLLRAQAKAQAKKAFPAHPHKPGRGGGPKLSARERLALKMRAKARATRDSASARETFKAEQAARAAHATRSQKTLQYRWAKVAAEAARPSGGAAPVHPPRDVLPQGAQGPQGLQVPQGPPRGKEAADAFREASREQSFAKLKLDLHKGLAEARRQEAESQADPVTAMDVKARAESRRTTFSQRWAKAAAEAGARPARLPVGPPVATGGLPLQKRQAGMVGSRAEEAQLLRFRQMSKAAAQRRGAIKAAAPTDAEADEAEAERSVHGPGPGTTFAGATFASGKRRPLRARGKLFQEAYKAERRSAFSDRWAKAAAEAGHDGTATALVSRPRVLQDQETEAEAEAEELEAEAEAEAEAEELEAEAETETETEAETGASNVAQADVEAEVKAAPVQAPVQEAEGPAPVQEEERPAEERVELAKLDAQVAQDVQSELAAMDAQDAEAELKAKRVARQLGQQQLADQQLADGQQAAQALAAAIGARSLVARQQAVLVAAPPGAEVSGEVAMQVREAAPEPLVQPDTARKEMQRSLQQKWRKAAEQGLSR